MLPPVGSRCQTRHDARGVMAKLRKVNSRNCTIAYDDAAADDQMPQVGVARASDRSNERIVQAEIARMRQVEDRKIGELAGSDHATIPEAEHAGAVGAPPAHHDLDADRAGPLDPPAGVPSAVHFTDHVCALV